MAVATVITNGGSAVIADRLQTTPTVNPPKYVAVGTGGGARTAAKTDVALTTEVETRGLGSESVLTTTETNDTYRVVGVVTATAPRSINEAALFTASSGGTMFLSATTATISLATNDSLQLTCNTQIT